MRGFRQFDAPVCVIIAYDRDLSESDDTACDCGAVATALVNAAWSRGLGTVINFQPTGGGKAAITGDYVMIASEVNPVIRALREHGIEVTSLHNHMLTDEPRLFFMHFWAHDDAARLARGLRAALDRTNVESAAARLIGCSTKRIEPRRRRSLGSREMASHNASTPSTSWYCSLPSSVAR